MVRAYKSKWIIAADGQLYEDCTLVVEEGKIDRIVKSNELEPIKHTRDCKNAVITPGFVNLHNHLQYTDIYKKREKHFFYYIKKALIELKKHYFVGGIKKQSFLYKLSDLLSEYYCMDRQSKINSFRHGLELSLLSGTTCVAQLSRESKYFDILNELPIKTYLFFELFSDSSETSKTEFRAIQKKIEKLLLQKSENTFVGVAPHSVCSVHKRLFKILAKYCRKNNILMTTRLYESHNELDWLKYGFSDVDLINVFTGVNKFNPYIKGVSPAVYLNELGVLGKKLIVSYLNYADEDDLKMLNEHEVSFAYCPRVSKKLHNMSLSFDDALKYFPEKFGFGTNSLAFNDDLSLLNELRSVNKGQLDALKAIEYLTIIPAKILRLNNIIGSLEKGKDADFNIFMLDDNENYEAILNKEKPDFVYIKGQRLVENGKLVSNIK